MSKNYKGPYMVVGFGKDQLTDLVNFIDTDKEIELLTAVTKLSPRYRRPAICSPEEVEAYKKYIDWLSKKVNK